MRFDAEFDDFYQKCLKELMARSNWSESFIPMLERYVTLTSTLQTLNEEIVNEKLTTEHTNRAEKTNKVTNPAWRMFLNLNREANELAKHLELSPATAPVQETKKAKGFNLETPMKKAV